jgi:hypothetical protein
MCVDTDGSFMCGCPEGMTIGLDKRTCEGKAAVTHVDAVASLVDLPFLLMVSCRYIYFSLV